MTSGIYIVQHPDSHCKRVGIGRPPEKHTRTVLQYKATTDLHLVTRHMWNYVGRKTTPTLSGATHRVCTDILNKFKDTVIKLLGTASGKQKKTLSTNIMRHHVKHRGCKFLHFTFIPREEKLVFFFFSPHGKSFTFYTSGGVKFLNAKFYTPHLDV